jgi:type VI secretion system secreted protein VgrG
MSSSLNKTTTITIEGTQIKAFRSLTITQSVHTYHHFELAFEHQQLEDQFTFDPSSKKSLIGKSINIIIKGEAADMAKLEFNGVIAEAELFQNDKAFWGAIVVRGHGLPYKLDTVPGISAYYDMSVTDIVSNCLSAYASPKSVSAPVGPSHTLPFAVRYRETYWNFLRRLAYDYGAWLYYDGQKLHFTSTLSGTPVPLTFGLNLHNLRSGSYSRYLSRSCRSKR